MEEWIAVDGMAISRRALFCRGRSVMANHVDRRRFLASGVAVAGLSNLTGSSVRADPLLPQVAQTRVRYSVFDPKANLESYRKGVAQMKQWSRENQDDPRGWDFQAAIHGNKTRRLPPFSRCEHKSWWFFPWHRAYLYFFERIIQKASGDGDFALPYWDWDAPYRNFLPQEFREPNSELYDATRVPELNAGSDGIHLDDLKLGNTMASRSFLGTRFRQGFGGHPNSSLDRGVMENPTHDSIHMQIGGQSENQTGNMGDPDRAAQDPIFWVHHCNVDRLWDVWLAKGHTNPTDPAWLGNLRQGRPSPWTFFDENGRPVVVTAADFIIGGPRLDYEYDSLNGNLRPLLANSQVRENINQQRMMAMAAPPRGGMDRPVEQDIFGDQARIMVTAPGNRTVMGEKPLHVQALIQAAERPKFMLAIPRAASEEPTAPGILLNVEGVRASGPPGVVFRVYLNEPNASAATKPDEANFVGSIAIFQSSSPEHRENGHQPASDGETYSFDISRLAQSLMQRGKWNPDVVDVAIVPWGIGGRTKPQSVVSFDRVSISIEK